MEDLIMSMRDYAMDDYGLVLDKETIKMIASKAIDDFEEYKNDFMIDWAYELYDHGICEYCSDFTGEAQYVGDEGYYYWGDEYESYNNDVIAYVQISHYPTLFKKAYNNMEEIVEEFMHE